MFGPPIPQTPLFGHREHARWPRRERPAHPARIKTLNPSRLRKRYSYPFQYRLAIIFHCCFFLIFFSIGHSVYFSLYDFIVRSSVGLFLFCYFSLCSIALEIRPRVLDFFFQTSIFKISSLSSSFSSLFSVVFIDLFLLLPRREREFSSRLLSSSLCIQSDSASEKKRKGKDRRRTSERTTDTHNDHFRHRIHLHLISPHARLEEGESTQEKRSLSLLWGRSSTREVWQPGSH